MSFWNLLQRMPSPVRYFFIRRIFTFSYALPKGLTFKIADEVDELEQAFRIIHDGFVERHLMDQNDEKLRINKYFALPTTSVIVCKYKDEVIATASVIQDTMFGLPTDEYRDLDQFRKKNMKLVEVSGLAIAKSWRKKQGQLMIPISKYMWEYVHWCLKADAIVISTAAYAKDFYRGLFLFEPLDQDKVVSFDSVKGSKTVSQILFLKPFLERLEKTYRKSPKQRSLWELSKHVYPEFKYPERPFYYASDAVLKPRELEYFFKDKSNVLKELSFVEKQYLAHLYHFQDYKNVIFEGKKELHQIGERNSMRAPVACAASALRPVGLSSELSGEVREVSRGGMKLVADSHNLDVGVDLQVMIQLNDRSKVSLKTKVKWKKGSELGLQILEHHSGWNSFINIIENRHPGMDLYDERRDLLKA
jgi:hypothetical protein